MRAKGILATAVAALALAAGTSASADTQVTRDAYTNFAAFICTTGENVSFEGVIQFREGSVDDAAGGLHRADGLTIHAAGTGQDTGNRYELVSVAVFTTTYLDPMNAQDARIRFRVTTQGVVIYSDFDLHVTITPDGTFVVFTIEDVTGCHGNITT
jgi:hypothetical protein